MALYNVYERGKEGREIGNLEKWFVIVVTRRSFQRDQNVLIPAKQQEPVSIWLWLLRSRLLGNFASSAGLH